MLTTMPHPNSAMWLGSGAISHSPLVLPAGAVVEPASPVPPGVAGRPVASGTRLRSKSSPEALGTSGATRSAKWLTAESMFFVAVEGLVAGAAASDGAVAGCDAAGCDSAVGAP